MGNVREEALKILLKVEEGGFLKDLLEERESSFSDERDYSLLYEITRGVLKEEKFLDYCIRETSSMPFRKIHLPILLILRLSLYQILFLDRVPSRAAVYEGVELAKKYGNRGSVGYVNGMLRNMSKGKFSKDSVKGKTPEETLAIRYSHPLFYIEDLVAQSGLDETEKLLKADGETPPFTVRVNTNLYTLEEFLMELEKYGGGKKTKISPFAVHVKSPKKLMNSPLYREGAFYVQDEGSMMPGELLNPESGDFILDVCAAPGGKSVNLALLNPEVRIVAGDLTEKKVKKINENIKRLGLNNINAVVRDGRFTSSKEREAFDKVLLDAPCSGLGLLRRKPEIGKRRKKEDVSELAKIQSKLLRSSFSAVKPGGKLCYSTCTLTAAENEEVIEGFLEEEPSAVLITKKVYYPHIHNTDGFKVFILKKEEG